MAIDFIGTKKVLQNNIIPFGKLNFSYFFCFYKIEGIIMIATPRRDRHTFGSNPSNNEILKSL